MEHKLLGGEPWFNNRPQEKLKWRRLLLTSPGGSGLIGPHKAVEAGCTQTETQELRYMLLLEFVGEVLWSSWVRSRMEDSNQRSGVLIIPIEVLYNDT